MSLGMALGWKFNNAPGILTVDGVLTGWPEALGDIPTEEEQEEILAEYEAFLSAPTIADYQTAIQEMVDETARGKQFNDGVTLASYANSTNPEWAGQALAFIAWRDQVWLYAYAELEKVQSGEREQPTVEQIIAELPLIAWS
ncbi:hypothetical protein [Rhizobium sp. Nf11,1]|uniref:hypothetical protein n=1 Tax=Rhizobium sp. Nf11,1 TaxID=3404923 RepID=UPI003D345113